MTREWRRLHNEELYALYSSPNTIRVVIKLRRMRWAVHVARWGTGELHIGFWWGDLRQGNLLEDLDVDGRIILKWIFKNSRAWT
jgi:hypothetical protein